MTSSTEKNGVIYWFRNDLRLHDHPALQKAIETAQQQQTWLLPVYIHDAALLEKTAWGFERTSPQRNAWTAMALRDLSRQLTEFGSDLLQMKGDPVECLKALCQIFQSAHVFCEDIAAPYEEDHIQRLKEANLKVDAIWQSTLMCISDLPFDATEVPDQFTLFRQAVERPTLKVKQPRPAIQQLPKLPNLLQSHVLQKLQALQPAAIVLSETISASVPISVPTPDPRSAFPWGPNQLDGGETSALAHLARYCNGMLPSRYKQTRNGLYGLDYSTKWSPWLATGALSPRQAWAAVKAHEKIYGANESTYWIGFELLWRDHFRWMHLKHGRKMYRFKGLSKQTVFKPHHQTEKFTAWCTGNTGHDFIDAGMRELISTSYVSNRMRQNLASYLIHDLACDWRAGAAWFESKLIDYDVYSNQGNWLYLSGHGTDPRGVRRFNPDKQAKDYDPEGVYRAMWLS